MKVVLDTGIFISALITDKGFPYKAVELWAEKEFELVTSQWQIEEFRDVSRRPHLTTRIIPNQAGALVNRLRRYATVFDYLPEVNYSPDPKDNPILSSAIEGQVQYVVSNDKSDMQALQKVEGIPIITVRHFVGMFTSIN